MQQVGHNNILNRLQNGNLGWVDDCAYVGAYYGTSDPDAAATAGMAVLDVADPRNPELVEILPGVPGTRESQVEGNQDSRMVVVVMTFPTNTIFGDTPAPSSMLHIYDASGDCTDLVPKGTHEFGTENGETIVTHEHRIWSDKIYATVTGTTQPGPAISVVYAGDKDNPELLTTWDLSDEAGMPESAAHDLDVSPDGTRAYINIRTPRPGGGAIQGWPSWTPARWPNGNRGCPVPRSVA